MPPVSNYVSHRGGRHATISKAQSRGQKRRTPASAGSDYPPLAQYLLASHGRRSRTTPSRRRQSASASGHPARERGNGARPAGRRTGAAPDVTKQNSSSVTTSGPAPLGRAIPTPGGAAVRMRRRLLRELDPGAERRAVHSGAQERAKWRLAISHKQAG